MIFVEKSKIGEFEKKCVIALFMDSYKYSLVQYYDNYHFSAKDGNGNIHNIYLFNAPDDKEEFCKVFQLRVNSKSTESIEYILLNSNFTYEFKDFAKNSFLFVKQHFWNKMWETKYPDLFDNAIPVPPKEYSSIYKYKMNPDDCDKKLGCGIAKEELGKFDNNLLCGTIKDKRQWFQDFIDGTVIFTNPKMFNDPYDCDCDIPYTESFAKLIYRALEKKISNESIVKAMEEMKWNKKDESEANPEYIKEIMRRASEIAVEKDKKRPLLAEDKLDEAIKRLFDYETRLQSIKEDVRVLCVSPHNNDILMWGYYGNCGQGLCCGYDYTKLLWDLSAAENNSICIYGTVHYDVEKPQYNPKTESKFDGLWEYVIDCMFTKYEKWHHEDEYRFVLLKEEFSSPVLLFKSEIESYYLGCLNESDPLQKKYVFQKGKDLHQLKKDSKKYLLIE